MSSKPRITRSATCVPQPTPSDHREQPSHLSFTESDVERAERDTGLKAHRLPSAVQLQPGSLKQTHHDVQGIRDTFVGPDTEALDLSRPPYAKQPSQQVLREMVDWERVKEEQLDALRSDPVYRFLADLATHARVDVEEFLQSKISSLRVGREIVERQEEAEIGLTPAPQEPVLRRAPTLPLTAVERRRQRRRQKELQRQLREGELTAASDTAEGEFGVTSRARVPRVRVKKEKAPRLKQRADLNRLQRTSAFDARTWLYRVEVIGRFAISDRAITAINYCYTRTLANAPQLNGVPVSYFMFSEHVSQIFAELCGLFLNNVDFRSRRTYIEISMSAEYKGAMRNLIIAFKHAVSWDANLRQLVLQSNPCSRGGGYPYYNKCQLTVYRRIDGCCTQTRGLALCTTGASTLPLYPC